MFWVYFCFYFHTAVSRSVVFSFHYLVGFLHHTTVHTFNSSLPAGCLHVRLTGRQFTCGEQHDGLDAAVLRWVHVQHLQLLHLLLEDPDVVHEGHHPVRRHRGRVEAGGGQQRGDVDGHGALRGVQDEQFAPGEAEQRHLVRHLQVREEGDVAGPLHGAEEHPGRQLTDVLDAHDVVVLQALGAEPGGRVGFGPQQQRDVSRQVGMTLKRVPVRQGELAVIRLRRKPASLDRCKGEQHMSAGDSTVTCGENCNMEETDVFLMQRWIKTTPQLTHTCPCLNLWAHVCGRAARWTGSADMDTNNCFRQLLERNVSFHLFLVHDLQIMACEIFFILFFHLGRVSLKDLILYIYYLKSRPSPRSLCAELTSSAASHVL